MGRVWLFRPRRLQARDEGVGGEAGGHGQQRAAGHRAGLRSGRPPNAGGGGILGNIATGTNQTNMMIWTYAMNTYLLAKLLARSW